MQLPPFEHPTAPSALASLAPYIRHASDACARRLITRRTAPWATCRPHRGGPKFVESADSVAKKGSRGAVKSDRKWLKCGNFVNFSDRDVRNLRKMTFGNQPRLAILNVGNKAPHTHTHTLRPRNLAKKSKNGGISRRAVGTATPQSFGRP